MRVATSALALLVTLASPLRADVTVRLNGGRVDIVANTVPLADVLDRLARQTGMKVVYDGPAPRQLVTVSLMGRLPAEAVYDLLEGQGLNYALLGDAAGTGVQTLLMTGSAGPGARPASPASSAPRIAGAPPMSSPDSVDDPEDELETEEEAAPQPNNSGAPSAATEGIPAMLLPPGLTPAGQARGATAPTPYTAPAGTAGAPSPFPVPRTEKLPSTPTTLPPSINPRFSPVSPLSPLGPFVPAVPTGTHGAVPGAPPNEPREGDEPPL